MTVSGSFSALTGGVGGWDDASGASVARGRER